MEVLLLAACFLIVLGGLYLMNRPRPRQKFDVQYRPDISTSLTSRPVVEVPRTLPRTPVRAHVPGSTVKGKPSSKSRRVSSSSTTTADTASIGYDPAITLLMSSGSSSNEASSFEGGGGSSGGAGASGSFDSPIDAGGGGDTNSCSSSSNGFALEGVPGQSFRVMGQG